jgi:SAM-dependent methyltransferase
MTETQPGSTDIGSAGLPEPGGAVQSTRPDDDDRRMKRTSERHHPDALLTAEDEAMDVRHRYAYSLVQRYATQGDRLLDVGSGEGYGAAIVSSWVTSYDGVDVSATAVAHAAKTYGAASVRFEHYDGRTLPYETDAFDLVVSFQVIEHVEDVDGYIQ